MVEIRSETVEERTSPGARSSGAIVSSFGIDNTAKGQPKERHFPCSKSYADANICHIVTVALCIAFHLK